MAPKYLWPKIVTAQNSYGQYDMVYIVIAHIVMAYLVMAYIAMAYIDMANIITAYI